MVPPCWPRLTAAPSWDGNSSSLKCSHTLQNDPKGFLSKCNYPTHPFCLSLFRSFSTPLSPTFFVCIFILTPSLSKDISIPLSTSTSVCVLQFTSLNLLLHLSLFLCLHHIPFYQYRPTFPSVILPSSPLSLFLFISSVPQCIDADGLAHVPGLGEAAGVHCESRLVHKVSARWLAVLTPWGLALAPTNSVSIYVCWSVFRSKSLPTGQLLWRAWEWVMSTDTLTALLLFLLCFGNSLWRPMGYPELGHVCRHITSPWPWFFCQFNMVAKGSRICGCYQGLLLVKWSCEAIMCPVCV